MEKKYEKNFIKQGDPSFVYDKRIDFTKKAAASVAESWDDDDF